MVFVDLFIIYIMENEKTIYEKLFIIFCLTIVFIGIYFGTKQPQVEGWSIYISGTIQRNWQTNWIENPKTATWWEQRPVDTVTENKTSVIQLRTWSIKPTDSKQVQSIQLMSTGVRVYVKWFPEYSFANNVATYAYWISDWDIDFLATLKAENWAFDMYKQSNVVKNWVREDSRWLCQLHRAWHRDIVDNPLFWSDWKWQLEQCYKKYKWWTKFYGYYQRNKYKNDFTIINN